MTASADPPAVRSRAGARFDELDVSRLPLAVTGWSVLVAGAVAGAVALGPTAVAGLVVLAAAVLAVGWVALFEPPRPALVRTVVALTGLLVGADLALTTGSHRLVWLPVSVAIGMIAAFFGQIIHPAGRDGLTAAMATTMSALLVVASGGAYAPLALAGQGPRHVLVAMAALAAAALVEPLGRRPRRAPWTMLLVMLAGGLASWLVAAAAGMAALGGLGLGLLVASLSVSVRRIFGARPGTRSAVGGLAVGLASVFLPGVVVLALAAAAGIGPA